MQFLVEMCLGSRSPQKAVTCSLFLVFRRKCVKMASQLGGQIAPKNRLFSHWSPFGCPWVHFLDFWPPWPSFWHLLGCPGHHFGTLGPHQNDVQALQNSMKVNPQTDLTAARWRGWANGQMDIRYCSCFICAAQVTMWKMTAPALHKSTAVV